MKTILTRPGNKRAIADKIIKHFPPHDTYIEPFFGAGGLFFEKPKAKKNLVNDADNDVFNLFQVIAAQPVKLRSALKSTPYHEAQLQYWKQHKETDPVKRALRFLFLSNYTIMGYGTTLRIDHGNAQQNTIDRIKPTVKFLEDVRFSNRDFRAFLKQIPASTYERKAFIYCDPPYLNTDSKGYSRKGWNAADLEELIRLCQATKAPFAISEFDSPEVLKIARKYKLKVTVIAERRNLNNRRTEILMTNY